MTIEAVVDINDAPMRMPSAYGEEEYWNGKAGYWKKRSIYEVPAYMTGMRTEAYCPQVVSLGPYHHDKEQPKPMEEHKARALFYFLKRSGKPLVVFQRALSEVLDNVMDCYDQLDEKWHNDRDAFLQLMILDGAFMLEILQKWTDSSDDYPDDDPIFSHHGKLYIMPVVQRDMLMLENQLPMLVLDKLVAVKSDGLEKDKESVNKLILQFYRMPVMATGECLHLLDVFRKGLLIHKGARSKNIKKVYTRLKLDRWKGHLIHMIKRGFKMQSGSVISQINKFRSATELDEAGIRLSSSKSVGLKAVSFRSGVLRLPVIIVDEASESMFLNLIAFERSHVRCGSEVTSYVYLMSTMLSNERDVTLLHSRGIIWNALSKDEDVVQLFKSLIQEFVTFPENKFLRICMDASLYCEKPWSKCRAKIVQTYFRSPWSIVNLIGAIFLFVLTIIQTIYTIHK